MRWLFFLGSLCVCCTAVACGGGGSSSPAGTVSGNNAPVAYLVYPPSGPYAAHADFDPVLVFATRNVDASYRVVLSPSPSPAQAPTSFPLNFSPTALPSPLATPPVPGPYTYATTQISQTNAQGITTDFLYAPTTSYTVTLVGPLMIAAGGFQTDCGFPPPTPLPAVQLVAPANGAKGVPANIGSITVAGYPYGYLGGVASLLLTPASGSAVTSTAPVPLSSAAPSGGTSPAQYVARIPTLAAATTYTVVLGYTDWANTPPSCAGPATLPLGSFTTQ